ncbi:MAG: 3-dehydro-L-gulonate 2-dehydrogenase [Clostridiales bacterium]|nr:3-dehydro-L-gulonate 2-dehydrogenase [Clostridiales bacterium]
MRIPYDEMKRELTRVLKKHGVEAGRAERSAELFADASRDGIYTHGLNRFPAFIRAIGDGDVDVHARASFEEKIGVMERWNGNRGIGNLNASAAMERAVALAKEYGIGVVGLKNTNHWMRPGNYGLMAVEKNCIGILWTNTLPNMPPWGGRDARLGNNPIVFAVPNGGEPVLLDIAMSMFAYGKLETYARQGRELPMDGGFDKNQQPTRDAAEIIETQQILPFGFWKGSGLALMLDLVAAAISGGLTTREVGEYPRETAVSQVFIAIDLESLPNRDLYLEQVKATLADLQTSTPREEGRPPAYPGQHMMAVRRENMKRGIPVEESIWDKIKAM